MSRNRRRHQNQVPIGDFSPWIIIAVVALVGGLTWVYFLNQRHTRGKEIKELETELAALKLDNEGLCTKIATLSSRPALQRRMTEGFIKMVPITQDRIVQLNGSRTRTGSADEIQVVSNEGVRR
jgi:hypothetical protein